MTTITVDRDPAYAPCSYLLCLVDDAGRWDTRNETKTRLVQLDWDFPGIASNFGFVPCDCCSSTDGTVDCEHRTALEMIQEAGAYLDDVCMLDWDDPRRLIDDPGYFEPI